MWEKEDALRKIGETDRRKDARDEELDRFWEIDALLPQRHPIQKSKNTDPVELTVAPRDGGASASREYRLPPRPQSLPNSTPTAPPKSSGEAQTIVHTAAAERQEIHRYIYPHTAEEAKKATPPDEEYTPQSALLHRVRLYRWKNSYPYYEEFATTALRLQKIKGKPCAPVKFFSYVPQYSQMTRAQLEWYLWLRECLQKKEAPDTDYSYLLLYAYEWINLSNRADPAKGQAALLFLWEAYHERYPQINSCLLEWICDYSLIHHLPPPSDPSPALLQEIVSGCRLKEFYVGGLQGDGYVQALLRFCCNYDYRKSKFCTPEHRSLFDRSVLLALRAVSNRLEQDGKLFSATGMEDICLKRDAYSGALCSWRVKRRMEIDYCSFSRSHELRFLITDAVKYTENRLRAHFGVRSRLTIYALPSHLRELIDTATAHLTPTKKRASTPKAEAVPAYERLYDLPQGELSLSNAAEIERSSWDTTERLIEAFSEEELPSTPSVEHTVPQPKEILPPVSPASAPSAEEEDTPTAHFAPYRAFLEAVLAGDAARQLEATRSLGMLPDAAADAVNELAAELMGDILIEDCGGSYAVIEDYRELLQGLVNQKGEKY